MLSGRAAHTNNQAGIVQKMSDPEGRPFYRVHGVAGYPVYDLISDPARSSADDRLAFPHRLRNRQAESLLNGFLKDNRGGSLKGIDLAIRLGGQLQHMDVGVGPRGGFNIG
jgi:hypothetical protein